MQSTLRDLLIIISAPMVLSLAGVVEHRMLHVVSRITKPIAKRNCS